ncbi:MAG: patatin-like phospholipase family protein [Anaerorhabdus sp.]
MKRALVLGGGGMRGAYEAGVVKALDQLGIEYHLITGVSIGALNGILLIQDGVDSVIDLWNVMDLSKVINGKVPSMESVEQFMQDAEHILPLLKSYIKEKGVDIAPLEELLRERFNEEKVQASSIDYGIVALEVPSLKPLFVTKEMMRGENAVNYLLASSACFPAFPLAQHDGKTYIDGGYFDNLPIDLAFEMGATEVIAVDLTIAPTHSNFLNRPSVTYIKPKYSLGLMFDFSRENMQKNMILGYLETMKVYENYDGLKYTFEKDGVQFHQGFHQTLLRQDHRCKKVWKILDDRLVYNKLCKENGCLTLSEEEINYAMLEQLMKWVDKDPYHLYSLKMVMEEIEVEFSKAQDEEFDILPSLSVKDVVSALQSMSRLELVKKILHQELYPSKKIISPKILETVFSLEMAVARWVMVNMTGGRK